MDNVQFTVGDDGVALIALALRDHPLNVLTPALIADLSACVERVLAEPAIRGAVLTSAKRVFVAGADLKELVTAFDAGITAVDAAHRFDTENRLLRRLETGGKPFVAAINGLALGGGLELCLACHHRLLADHPKAQVGLPEVTVGLLPAGGGTQRLPRLIGIAAALPLLLEGRALAPAEALRLGVVNALAPADELVARARAWVLANPEARQPWDEKGFRLPGGAGCLAPHAPASFQANATRLRRNGGDRYPAGAAILAAVFEGTQVPMDAALRIEANYFGTLLADPVARNLIRTLFINKGAADKGVRCPPGAEAAPLRRIGVIGQGEQADAIAYAAAAAGISVTLTDAAAPARIKALAAAHNAKPDDDIEARLTVADAEALARCELLLEAAGEEAKAAALAALPLRTEAALCATTSAAGATVAALAEHCRRPDRLVGLHWLGPVQASPMVEIVRGPRSAPLAVAQALQLARQLGKTPLVVEDSPGFFTIRLFWSYVDEGMQLLADGVEPALIENAARQVGLRLGPLAALDAAGIDRRWSAIQRAAEDGFDARFRKPPGHAVCRRLVEQLHRTGRAAGAGFYDYDSAGNTRLWDGLREQFPSAAQQPDAEHIQQRLLCIQSLTALRCLEKGVLATAEEGDLASVLGVGFPAWTGGALSYIDTLGGATFLQTCRALADDCGQRFQPSSRLVGRIERGPLVGFLGSPSESAPCSSDA